MRATLYGDVNFALRLQPVYGTAHHKRLRWMLWATSVKASLWVGDQDKRYAGCSLQCQFDTDLGQPISVYSEVNAKKFWKRRAN